MLSSAGLTLVLEKERETSDIALYSPVTVIVTNVAFPVLSFAKIIAKKLVGMWIFQ